MMKNWRKPAIAKVTAIQVGESIKANAWTCLNGYIR